MQDEESWARRRESSQADGVSEGQKGVSKVVWGRFRAMKFNTGIESYCQYLAMAGRAAATIASYRQTLRHVSEALPPESDWESVTVQMALEILSRKVCALPRGTGRWRVCGAFRDGHLRQAIAAVTVWQVCRRSGGWDER